MNTAKHDEIIETSEIELSRDEDSVTSMAVAHASESTASSASGGSVIVLAGLNSSMAEQKRDNNQHLRAFRIDLVRRADEEARGEKGESGTERKTTIKADESLLSRVSLFRSKGAKAGSDTYQRVVRVSPWRRKDDGDHDHGQDGEGTRVAAITTGLAPSGEVVFFQATETPSETDVIGRVQLGDGEEAEDVDIIDLAAEKGKGKDKNFQVAYTNGVDVFTCQISSGTRANTSPEVDCVYTTPVPENGTKKSRPKFRALRFLSPTALLLLQNAPDRSGCELVVLELPSPSPNGEKREKKSATVIRRKKLRRTIKIGLGLDVCNLGPGPDAQQQQSIIAVTGSDQSIELLTINHDPGRNGRQGLGGIKHYATLRDVHPFSVTSISFSNFISPSSSRTLEPQEQHQQYVKLASVSMGNTVVVHTLPLTHIGGQRYVLSAPDTWSTLTGSPALFTVLVLLLGLLLQGILEIRGGSPTYLGVGEWIPAHIRDIVAPAPASAPAPPAAIPSPQLPLVSVSAESESEPSPTATTTISVQPNTQRQTLRDIILAKQDTDTPSTILVRYSSDNNNNNEILIEATQPETQAQTHDEDQNQDKGKPWELLTEDQRALWKQRLIDAGRWTVTEGEAILAGVLFSEYGGVVGGLVGGEDIL